MQHEGDEMKVASYPQSSRFLVAKGSRGNSFSMRVRMPVTSKYLFTQEVEKSFPESPQCIYGSLRYPEKLVIIHWIFQDFPPRFLHRISWESFFPLACPDVLIDTLVPSRSSQIDYIITCIFNRFHYILTESAIMTYSISVVLA